MHLVNSLVSWLAPTRLYAGAAIATVLLAAASCFIPLVNLIGYESAALFGVAGGVGAMFLTLHAAAAGVVAAPLEKTRTTSPGADFFVLLMRHLALLAIPALALGLNALRVTNCAFGVGALFWLSIAVPSIFFGQLVAWCAVIVAPRKPLAQVALCAAAVVASAAVPLAHLALQPPIVGHQLLLGYFSGSIYDEALSLPSSLVWYRLMHLGLAVAALAAVEALWRRRRERPVRWMLLIALVGVAGCAAIWWQRMDRGIGIDRTYIEEELGGRIETEHFIIYHPQTPYFLELRDQMAEEHEFYYARLGDFFGTDPASAGKLRSYVYANRAEKGRLMGGRQTMVAKLWLHEMHILWNHDGDHKLAHELAHIFTEPFGAGPLRLSMQRGVGVNMGLVEGVAAAAEWPVRELDPHEASAALRRLELAPQIRSVVAASGFWSQSSGRAYTLVGSFVRFLIDEYGVDTFKQAYPAGDFRGAYGKGADELVGEWEAFLDEVELSEHDLELARYLYDRRSIFDKVCARQIAEMRRKARQAAQSGRVGRVSEIYEAILAYTSDNVDNRIGYVQALGEARRFEKALEQVEATLDAEHPPATRARLLDLRGDLLWRRGRPDLAQQSYGECAELGVPANRARMLEVKSDVLGADDERVRRLAFEYLLGQKPAGVSLYYPMRWHDIDPNDPVAAYLVGRRLWMEYQYEEAVDFLERALEGGLAPTLAAENARLLGMAHYWSGNLDRAEAIFDELGESELSGYRETARLWSARIAWKRGNRIGTH
jgi:tetratricopeptide (TPR) repeat protein